MQAVRLAWLSLALTLTLGAAPAHADDVLTWGGRVQTDIRFRPSTLAQGTWYNQQVFPKGVARNQNLFKLRAAGQVGRVSAQTDVDFLWLGITDGVQTFNDLTQRQQIDPYRLKAHAAYVQARDIFVAGLDLRVGQQIVNWGKGDQFNPTNTINSNDFEDPLLFGQQLANSMIRADYSPEGSWSLSAVLVPIFKPAVLPFSAMLALADLRRIPIDQADLRRTILANQALALQTQGYPTVVDQAIPALPAFAFDNMQAAIRLAWSAHDQDLAVSYYYGRSDMPQPYQNDTIQVMNRQCNPPDSTNCINGTLATSVRLHYPRVQMVGLNMAGELPLLGFLGDTVAPFGYHVELGVFFPQMQSLRLYNAPILGQPAGEYPYDLGAGTYPEVLATTPFAKWNIGLDYTLFERVYVNAQWVHGFVDEFGAGDFLHPGLTSIRGTVAGGFDPTRNVQEILRNRLGDYLVLGADMKFLADQLLTRLFIIYDLTGMWMEEYVASQQQRVRRRLSPFGSGASAVIFPEITYNVGGGLELSVGALAKLGEDYTKFGDPAAGGTEVWSRARYSY